MTQKDQTAKLENQQTQEKEYHKDTTMSQGK